MEVKDDGLPSHEEFLIEYGDLEFGKKIGRGQYGHVFKGEYLGTCVAIKQCVFEGEEQEMMQKYIAREISILKEVRHPNIVNFIGISKRMGASPRNKDKEIIYIVTEWVPHGNLHSYFKNKHNVISWETRVNMAIDIAASMAFLHQKNFIHRDLKSENLLIAENERVKLCDFGFARFKSKGRLMTLAGTEQYMAPEVILGEDYGDKCDVFGFGVVLVEMIARKSPPMRGPATCFDFRPDDIEAFFPPDCPPLLKDLTKKCIQYLPKDRPSFKQALVDLKSVRAELVAAKKAAELAGGQAVVNKDRAETSPLALENRDRRERSFALNRKSLESTRRRALRDRDRKLAEPRQRSSLGLQQGDGDVDDYDERGPEICFDDDERGPEIIEDERGPEIIEDERGPEIIEDERGPEIIDDERGPEIIDERGPGIIEDERGPEIIDDERGPEIIVEGERTEKEQEDERGPEIDVEPPAKTTDEGEEKKKHKKQKKEKKEKKEKKPKTPRRGARDERAATAPDQQPNPAILRRKEEVAVNSPQWSRRPHHHPPSPTPPPESPRRGDLHLSHQGELKSPCHVKSPRQGEPPSPRQAEIKSPRQHQGEPTSPRQGELPSPRSRIDAWRYALVGQWSLTAEEKEVRKNAKKSRKKSNGSSSKKSSSSNKKQDEADHQDSNSEPRMVAQLQFQPVDPRRKDSLVNTPHADAHVVEKGKVG